MKKTIALAALTLLALTGCTETSKGMQGYADAHVSGSNKDAAEVGTMPDGFNNFASKCDHGNRVYTTFHGDSAYGGIAVVPNDPTCA